jgi:hypothetical protein
VPISVRNALARASRLETTLTPIEDLRHHTPKRRLAGWTKRCSTRARWGHAAADVVQQLTHRLTRRVLGGIGLGSCGSTVRHPSPADDHQVGALVTLPQGDQGPIWSRSEMPLSQSAGLVMPMQARQVLRCGWSPPASTKTPGLLGFYSFAPRLGSTSGRSPAQLPVRHGRAKSVRSNLARSARLPHNRASRRVDAESRCFSDAGVYVGRMYLERRDYLVT